MLQGLAIAPWAVDRAGAAPAGEHASRRADDHPVAHRKAAALVQPLLGEQGCTGIALGVVRAGTVVVAQGYGVRDLQSNAPPDVDTVFWIQSLSKALTAVGLLALVGDGRVRLDEPASRHVRALPSRWASITVRQFMAHQSGIPQLDRKLPSFEAMTAAAEAIPLAFPPGTREEYNNFNFAVVGKVIEAAAGQGYLAFMRERVFAPAGMTKTGLDIVDANHAVSYHASPRGLRPIDREPPEASYGVPSGHLQSTLSDLLNLHAALESGQLLKPGPYRQMITRAVPRFDGTAGWFERRHGAASVVSKNGLGSGFQTNFAFVPGEGHAVITLCTSQAKGDREVQRVVDALFTDVCGVPAGR
ncbi:MAG: serine hydrolase domain-containing protein [Rubrivivax sp.]